MPSQDILVTGASGFIGGRIAAALEARGKRVRRMSRAPATGAAVQADLLDPASLERACRDVELVFHSAGHAHAFEARGAAAERAHHEVNYLGTMNLADAAGRSGVRGFVFLSSVKAMGAPGRATADESWAAPPLGAYGRAKRAAECAVLDAASRYGMRATNLRLAMVYGRGSRGNLERMANGIRQGWFPPLPETGAKRSLVHVADVVEAALLVAERPEAVGQTYIVADAQAYSGRELYDALRECLGRPPARLRCPAGLLRLAGAVGDALARLAARPFPLDGPAVERLLGAERYSPALIERDLGWRARVALPAGLAEAFGRAEHVQ